MANAISHPHLCCHCGKEYTCDFPECTELTGYQRLCPRDSYLYGWARAKDKEANDWSAL